VRHLRTVRELLPQQHQFSVQHLYSIPHRHTSRHPRSESIDGIKLPTSAKRREFGRARLCIDGTALFDAIDRHIIATSTPHPLRVAINRHRPNTQPNLLTIHFFRLINLKKSAPIPLNNSEFHIQTSILYHLLPATD
jgi:hypothetical protein